MRNLGRFLLLRRRLVVAGVASELIYALYLVPRYSLLAQIHGPYQDMGQMNGHSFAGGLGYLIATAVLFALFVRGWYEVRRHRDTATLWLVLGFGGLFALTAVFIYPITALDIFAYIDQSLVMVQYHRNPIFVPANAFPADPLMSLSDGWGGIGSPYGPLGLVLDAVPTLLVGRNLLANVILLKLMFSAMSLAGAFMACRIVQRIEPRLAVAGALLLAWNPLVLFEVGANGHNDAAMMFVALLGLLSVADDDLTVGTAVVFASALVKYATLVLVPPIMLYSLSRQPTWGARLRYLSITIALMLAIAAVSYARFWEGPQTFTRVLAVNQVYLYSFPKTLSYLTGARITPDEATAIGRILFLPVYGYALWLSTRGLTGLLRGCLLAMFAFLGLAVDSVEYWYVVVLAGLAATVPRLADRVAIVMMDAGMEGGVVFMNVYLWVWVGVSEATFRPINNVSYVLIFVLPAIVLVDWGRFRWRRVPLTP